MTAIVRRRVLVRGEVQGVWFRQSTLGTARALGVGGWVRNRPDGAVEAVFEGPVEAVEAAVAWCGAGPPRARVDEVSVEVEPPEGLVTFAIRE